MNEPEPYAWCPRCDQMTAIFTPDYPDADLKCLRCGFVEREPFDDWGD